MPVVTFISARGETRRGEPADAALPSGAALRHTSHSIDVAVGTSLLDAAMLAGVTISAPCGGEGVCGECRVRVTHGTVERLQRGGLLPEELAEGWALACSSRVLGDATILLVPQSADGQPGMTQIVASESRVFEEAAEKDESPRPCVPASPRPLSQPPAVKRCIRVPPPELGQGSCDYERLTRALRSCENPFSRAPGPDSAPDSAGKGSRGGRCEKGFSLQQYVTAGLDVLRELAAGLRACDGEVTVTITPDDSGGAAEILRVEAGDTTDRQVGVAIDVGTTTCAVSLVDLVRNRLLGTAADYNGQLARGADIISRINYAVGGPASLRLCSGQAGTTDGGRDARPPERLQELRRLVLGTLNPLIAGLCEQHGYQPSEVTNVAVAGNTTMMHLLLGLDPQYIRLEPYTPTVNQPPPLRAAEVGLHVHPAARVVVSPSVGSYVGGDIAAGLLRTALALGGAEDDAAMGRPRVSASDAGRDAGPPVRLFLDIGTNGEIVVGTGEWLMACAASAGPAFEGTGVGCGMRATPGAIERVALDVDPASPGTPSLGVVGGGRPRGVCGSGMVDLLAELWLAGLLDPSGKLHPERGGGRIRPTDGQSRNLEYTIVPAEASDTGKAITLDERDIQNLLRTKAAVYAAGALMLRSVGLDFDAVTEVYVAGGFGRYLDLRKAILIGLLPDLPLERFIYLGNASLAGAQMMLCSAAARRRVLEIARRITYIELNVDPAYMSEYTAALFLPHTDLERFPSVKAKARMTKIE